MIVQMVLNPNVCCACTWRDGTVFMLCHACEVTLNQIKTAPVKDGEINTGFVRRCPTQASVFVISMDKAAD